MADNRDLGALAKELMNVRVQGTEDIRKVTDQLRVFHMDCSEVDDAVEFEIRSALQWFDRGQSRRARAVTRPLRQMQTMETLCARRAVAVYKTYLKQFSEDLARNRSTGQRRFDPEK